MNRAQRAVLVVGMVVVLFAAWRLLTPFSIKPLYKTPGRDAVADLLNQPTHCGIVATQAAKGPSVRHEAGQLSAAGQAQKAADQQAHSRSATALIDPFANVKPDSAYDHITVTTFTLSPCTAAARRKATTAGVLAALAIVGTAGAFLVLRAPKRPTPREPADASVA